MRRIGMVEQGLSWSVSKMLFKSQTVYSNKNYVTEHSVTC